MLRMGLNTQPGNPIINAWISADGQYAFVEFRSVEECTNGMMLSGAPILGQPIRMARPKGYTGPPDSVPPLGATLLAEAALPQLVRGCASARARGLPLTAPARSPRLPRWACRTVRCPTR